MQRDTPNTKAIFDLPAIKNTKSVLNTLVHIIFLRLFSLYISLFLYIFVDHFLPRCRENECESPLYACSVSLCFKRTFWHILWEIHQKAFSYLIHVNCSKNLIAFVPPLAITDLSLVRLLQHSSWKRLKHRATESKIISWTWYLIIKLHISYTQFSEFLFISIKHTYSNFTLNWIGMNKACIISKW